MIPLQTDPATIVDGVNTMWVLTVTFLIFFMHAGFAMLEAGQVRAKNVANQLTKNMLTWSVGVILYFLVGAAVATIVGGITGGGDYSFVEAFTSNLSPGNTDAWVSWLFGAVFAMTAATIVSGAVAGRAKLRAYVGYTIMLAAVIYPVVQGMTWAGGFLSTVLGAGFNDFAGGMIVHGMGGIAGLTAAYIIGPRMDRYNNDGSVNVIPGHSMTFAVLGTLILCFGWYGFNVGTAATVFTTTQEGALALGAFGTSVTAAGSVGRVAMTTTLSMGAGAIGAAAISLLKSDKVDTLYVANGMLAGLVGITSITHLSTWWGALLVGLLAGGQLPIVFGFVEKNLKIDDVCAVFPVHGSAGMLGAIMLPFVSINGFSATVLAAQVVGVLVIAVWTIVATGVVFGVFKALGQARVSESHEREGLDISEHGVETYPEFSRGDETAVTDGGSGPTYETDGGVLSDTKAASADPRSDGGVPSEPNFETDGGYENDGEN